MLNNIISIAYSHVNVNHSEMKKKEKVARSVDFESKVAATRATSIYREVLRRESLFTGGVVEDRRGT